MTALPNILPVNIPPQRPARLRPFQHNTLLAYNHSNAHSQPPARDHSAAISCPPAAIPPQGLAQTSACRQTRSTPDDPPEARLHPAPAILLRPHTCACCPTKAPPCSYDVPDLHPAPRACPRHRHSANRAAPSARPFHPAPTATPTRSNTPSARRAKKMRAIVFFALLL